MPKRKAAEPATTDKKYASALARAFAGAMIFSMPMLMTMEMWWLGFTLDPVRLLVFTIAHIALLYGMSRVSGFESSRNPLDDLLDAFAAYGVAAITAVVVLTLIGELQAYMPLREIAGKISVQTIPASFGAMIGAKMMGEGDAIEQGEHWRATYAGGLFLMLAGAVFLSLTVAPTEEMILIAYKMTAWHALLMTLLSILLLHAILYMVGFPGQKKRRGKGAIAEILRHSLPGYAIAVFACAFILWSFGRVDHTNPTIVVMTITVLALPASIGAGIARIVV